MTLTFDKALVQKLVEHSEQSTFHKVIYGRNDTRVPGLWLVGDEGVYLMSNGDPGLKDEGSQTGGNVCCYADQCDPKRMTFDDWRDAKQASFGGDDGCEFIPARDIRTALGVPGGKVKIRLSRNRISFV